MKILRSRDNPFFKEMLGLAGSARRRREAALALLDGPHLLAACLDAGLRPQHILLGESARQDGEITALLQRIPDIPVTLLDDSLFARLSELKTPTGVIALLPLRHPPAGGTSRFALLLEDIQDPGNLGSMIRSAAAAGCDAVFLSGGCADPWSPKALRAGMGGHFALAVHESCDLPALAAGFAGTVYAAAPEAARSLYDSDLGGAAAFAVGNEGSGLSAALRQVCTAVSIPMQGKVESLNAAAAAAICLFEAVRQRVRHG